MPSHEYYRPQVNELPFHRTEIDHDSFIDDLSVEVFPEEMNVAEMAMRLAREALEETVVVNNVVNIDDYRREHGRIVA